MNENTAAQQGADPNEHESPTEIRMRADFMHANQYIDRDPEDYDPADSVEQAEYSLPWLTRGDEWTAHWCYLEDATNRWRADRDEAADVTMIADAEGVLSPIHLRSEEQACHIAEHGVERDAYGLLTSHYVTRVENYYDTLPGEITPPATVAPSALADYRPGNALATHAANIEREGVQR
ncbi:hypothetical protein [Nocardia bovistercoris]|uniref:Uncharacterized protein n=1 Tax=Nocardia bovistercoris TaxID=2785916 RepID=A0A931IA93_9NOCA|nr:hypothetical protein [Nocardia bovistercoris]MBH0777281.1 hypothetical protein [Nocardia bovistercoris]